MIRLDAGMLLLALLPVLAACDSDGLAPDAELIALGIDRELYAPGDTIDIEIENRAGRDVEWGHCNWILERWDAEATEWEELHNPGCLLILLTLEAGGAFTKRYALPSWLQLYPRLLGADTRYRIHASEAFDSFPDVFTNEFAIVGRE